MPCEQVFELRLGGARAADDLQTVDDDPAKLQLRDLFVDVPNHDEPSADPQAPQRCVEGRRSDAINDDTRRRRRQVSMKPIACVDHDMRCSERAQVAVIRSAHDRDDLGAERASSTAHRPTPPCAHDDDHVTR